MDTAITTANALAIASDPTTCLDDLAMLSWSLCPKVRAAVADNPATSAGVLRELVRDKDIAVALTAKNELSARGLDIQQKRRGKRAELLNRRTNILISDILAA